MAADEQLRTVTQRPISDLEVRINLIANAIGWAMYADEKQRAEKADPETEAIILTDEEITKCKMAAIRVIEHLQHYEGRL